MAHIGLNVSEPKPIRLLMQAQEKAARIAARQPAKREPEKAEAAA